MRKLDVFLASSPCESRRVGQLAESANRIYFEYDSDFLQSPLWLSPFKLPPAAGLIEHREHAFGPLFGLFDDSLPDGWGLLLMDRHFQRQGITPQSVSALDRLAYLGDRTMGALTYYPPASEETQDRRGIDLQALSLESQMVLEGKSEDILPQLLQAGGSPGGARPKVLVGVRGDDMICGESDLPLGYSAWLVKFHHCREAIEDGRMEYAYSLMARSAGLDMPETRLFTTSDGSAFFGVKRFDRHLNQRMHVHTFGNLIHSDRRIPGCDYQSLLKVARVLTKNQAEVQEAFRMMVFNVLARNRDDHVKNFAFVMDPDVGEWHLSPAYDLTFAHGPGGEHSMTVAGEGKAPGMRQIMEVARDAGIDPVEAMEIVAGVENSVAQWDSFAEHAGISKKLRRDTEKILGVGILRP